MSTKNYYLTIGNALFNVIILGLNYIKLTLKPIGNWIVWF